MILVIDNYDSFTWNLVHRFAEVEPSLRLDRDVRVVRNDAITPDDAETIDGGRAPTHLVVSPGPCSPREAGVSSAMIGRFAGRIPVLGVCLGHQCMAAEAGMTVARHAVQVHGKTSPVRHDGRGVFAGLPDPFEAMRYHSLIVEPGTIPGPPTRGPDGRPARDGWEVSAWTEDRDDSGGVRRVVMGLRRVFADPAKHPVEGVMKLSG